jgi:hypothetical protein
MPSVRLKYIATKPFAIWLSFVSALLGFLFGIIFGLMSLPTFGLRYGVYYILLWMLVTPTVFAVIGLLASLTGAVIYNTLVRSRGGVFFEFGDDASKVELTPPPPNF